MALRWLRDSYVRVDPVPGAQVWQREKSVRQGKILGITLVSLGVALVAAFVVISQTGIMR